MQPTNEPWGSFGDKLVVQNTPTIGDELSAAGISWGWYAGGWDNAAGNTTGPGWTNGPGPTCSRSEPRSRTRPTTIRSARTTRSSSTTSRSAYFANYAPGTTPERRTSATRWRSRTRPARRRPSATSTRSASSSRSARRTSIRVRQRAERQHAPDRAAPADPATARARRTRWSIVTYDEFGGQWDHVSPPGQGNNNGPHDQWGPGTRIPALVDLAVPAWELGRRPHAIRHDVDPRADRAALRASALTISRRGRQQPVERLRRQAVRSGEVTRLDEGDAAHGGGLVDLRLLSTSSSAAASLRRSRR